MQLSTEHQCVSLSGESEVMALQSRIGHSHTHSTSRGSRQVFLHLYSATQSQEMSSKGVFLNPCVCDSHGTLTRSNTSRCENKKKPRPLSKIQSLTSEVLGNLFACWSVMSWLAHILPWPLFSFTDFFHSAARSRDGWRRGWSPGICLA